MLWYSFSRFVIKVFNLYILFFSNLQGKDYIYDLYSTNLISNPNCICGYQNENADHYLLFCNRYIVYRNKILSSLAILNMNGVEINVDILLFGNDFLSDETNCEIFLIIQRYIKFSIIVTKQPGEFPYRYTILTKMLTWYSNDHN